MSWANREQLRAEGRPMGEPRVSVAKADTTARCVRARVVREADRNDKMIV